MSSRDIPKITSPLRNSIIEMPDCIRKASGIELYGKRIKSIVYSLDVSLIAKTDADAILCVYPIVKKHYHNIFNSYKKETLFGGLQKISISDDLFILNSFSQFNYGSNKDIIYTDYDKLFNNIKKALEFANFKNLKLYIPKYIGCGLANGDWSKVENFILSLNSDNIIICYL